MFSSLGRSTFEQDAWRIRPFMPHGAGTTVVGSLVPEFVPAIYDTTDSYVGFYGYMHSTGITSESQAWHISNSAYGGTAVTVYPIIAVPSSSDGTVTYIMRCEYSPVNGTGWTYTTTTPGTSPFSTYGVTNSPGAYKLPGLALANGASGLWQLQFYFERRGTAASDTVDDSVICIGWLVEYG